MDMKRTISFVLATAVLGSPVFAQQSAVDAARQESVIQQALHTYQQGLTDLAQPTMQPGSGGERAIALEEAVTLALEKNLDIQVAKLDPQAADFLVAGVRNTYRPSFNSTLGLRDAYALPTSTLNGGTKVNNGTRTYNFGLAQTVSKFGGSYTVNWTNSRVETSNSFSTFNPSFQTNLIAAYTQPVLRGFKIDNTRQQLLININSQDISEENAKATVAQTLANVRNAYWDLVFAQSSVEVAQRA